ncbi:MAG: hypothetical protein DWQ07_05355 [Chloroflexi bacterium]|nr:MAG: hypothetical protein DWQ07_05355 [Chloroflexota bacterium]MBL1194860.1 hypothetical protein [Chloroflexota bacterium]NOH12151.1 chemotaxis protein CheX [Chloroflexota bacterium]
MNIHIAQSFLKAVHDVLAIETQQKMRRGDISLSREAYSSSEVTVILNMIGDIKGMVFYAMTRQYAIGLASKILGEEMNKLDSLAQSGIAELGNVMTGKASVTLSQMGYDVDITAPTLILGENAMISTLDIPRLVMELHGESGGLVLHLALKEFRPPRPQEQEAVAVNGVSG